MWPFKRKNKLSESPSVLLDGLNLPGDEMAHLFKQAVQELGEEGAIEIFFERCDFNLARDEMANFFKIADAEAQRQGQDGVVYKKEFVSGWHAFSANPCADTARSWLRAAPDYKKMIHASFIECCPGGKFAFYSSIKR